MEPRTGSSAGHLQSLAGVLPAETPDRPSCVHGRPTKRARGQRIEAIHAAGVKAIVALLVTGVSEVQALQLEAELISAFGTEDTGGLLTNTVIPSGLGGKRRREVVVPSGAKENAQLGLELLKGAVLDFVKANGTGVTNSDTASLL